VLGMVLVVGEVVEWSGKNADGSTYTTYRRQFEVFAGSGSGTVKCSEAKKVNEFGPVSLGQVVSWPIIGAKTEGKQMIFRVSLDV